MKKILITIGFFLVFSGLMFAQDTLRVDTAANKIIYQLSKSHFKLIINEKFGNLMGSQSRTNIGNFASLDLTDSKVSFAGNIIFNGGSILGIKTTGGVSDGFLSVYSNSKLNSTIGIDLQYNILVNRVSISSDAESIRAFKKKEKEIIDRYDLQELRIKNNDLTSTLLQKIEKLKIKKETLKAEISLNYLKVENGYDKSLIKLKVEELESRKKAIEAKILIEQRKLQKDSLRFEVAKVENEIALLEFDENPVLLNKININQIEKIDNEIKILEEEIDLMPSDLIQLEINNNLKSKEIKKLLSNTKESEIETTGFALGWFSVGYALKNNSFRLFSSDTTFVNQVTKDSYASHKFNFQYSYYNLSIASYESFYITSGFSVGIGDNFSGLSKVEINERTNYGTNPDDRYSIKKYNAYKGDYANELKFVSLYADFYWFLFEGNVGAFHLYPEYFIKDKITPALNFGIGFLLAFKDKAKKSNVLNSEFYMNLKDLNNSNKSDENILNRSDFGIRFTFPIKFSTSTKN